MRALSIRQPYAVDSFDKLKTAAIDGPFRQPKWLLQKDFRV
jgi:hypothetical protein